jgi:hypothetical protein
LIDSGKVESDWAGASEINKAQSLAEMKEKSPGQLLQANPFW